MLEELPPELEEELELLLDEVELDALDEELEDEVEPVPADTELVSLLSLSPQALNIKEINRSAK